MISSFFSKLLIVGTGPLINFLKFKIKNLKLRDSVILYGWAKDPAEVTHLLNQSKVLVMPSYNEGGPRVVLEAMAAKLPGIATRVGAVPEISEDGKNGMLIEPARPEQIAARIQELLNSEHLRQELGIQAHQTVLFKFPLEKMLNQIERVISNN